MLRPHRSRKATLKVHEPTEVGFWIFIHNGFRRSKSFDAFSRDLNRLLLLLHFFISKSAEGRKVECEVNELTEDGNENLFVLGLCVNEVNRAWRWWKVEHDKRIWLRKTSRLFVAVKSQNSSAFQVTSRNPQTTPAPCRMWRLSCSSLRRNPIFHLISSNFSALRSLSYLIAPPPFATFHCAEC